MSLDLYDDITEEHAEEAIFLWHLRTLATRQPHYLLDDLDLLDNRIAAHVDGLRINAEVGWAACRAQLADTGMPAIAPLTLMALEAADHARLESLFELAEHEPAFQPALESAFGWVSPQFLRGTVQAMLQSASPLRRRIGIACCAMHRVDPGPVLLSAIIDADPALRARALRSMGELGRQDLLEGCLHSLADEDPACRYWAGASALLLGNRGRAVEALVAMGAAAGPWQARALRRVLKVLDASTARTLLSPLSQQPAALRVLIQGVGHTGQIAYCDWLIERMRSLETARLAAEAFTFITGADLAELELERPPLDDVEFGPNDDPDDDNVAMDEDEDLPWPEADRVAEWWRIQAPRFSEGTRYFLGEPPTRGHCLRVLRYGCQRQRIAAAQYLCLLEPGTPLFPVNAPAWRQLHLLNEMGRRDEAEAACLAPV
ncbi:TIGR02270 family protein [Pseudomonas indica]|uniref:TIGR02270 family protein n=1 Tax=Pseudomonas indica TaxID=137658 RepID=UPI0023F97464|nr:TIGR02270 family protein [Pseudomonas indica]MBU3059268.1 TIGR02270 family protein [Pseudomonas indica]